MQVSKFSVFKLLSKTENVFPMRAESQTALEFKNFAGYHGQHKNDRALRILRFTSPEKKTLLKGKLYGLLASLEHQKLQTDDNTAFSLSFEALKTNPFALRRSKNQCGVE